MSLHEFSLTTTPEMLALLALVRQRMLQAPDEAAKAQRDFEVSLREHMLALERGVHVADFGRLDVDVHGIVVDGVRFKRRKERTPGEYMTLAGTIYVERTSCRERGGHGGRTVVPLELRLGLVDGQWTLAAAEAACAFMASVPSKEAASLLRAAGSMRPSSSNLDRLPKRVSEVWEKGRVAFETMTRDAERLDLPGSEKVAHIALSLDGIMLPMKDAPRTPGLGKKDQGPKGHREVGCASVSLYASARPNTRCQYPTSRKRPCLKPTSEKCATLRRARRPWSSPARTARSCRRRVPAEASQKARPRKRPLRRRDRRPARRASTERCKGTPRRMANTRGWSTWNTVFTVSRFPEPRAFRNRWARAMSNASLPSEATKERRPCQAG